MARVVELLAPEDFYRENNGQVYRAALNLFRDSRPIDNVTLAAELEKLGVLDRVGGRTQLALFQEQVPTVRIPGQSDHPFRSNPITHSGVFDHPS
jgi:replicative DNA helicase